MSDNCHAVSTVATEPEDTTGKLIFTSKLYQLRDTVLDLSPFATPCRYRFVDCEAFLQAQQLDIYEFDGSHTYDSASSHLTSSGSPPHPPNVTYTSISYTWRGNETNTDDPSSPHYWEDMHGTFQVKGAEDGDPISLDVLEHVCIAIRNHSRYLWLDRLCILQTSKPDKIWQITRMYSIYTSCKMCCILPGGIRRLVRLNERTSWIDRGWTLQEAIVPKQTVVLFRWDRVINAKNTAIRVTMTKFRIANVVEGQSACTDLLDLLHASVTSGRGVKLFIDGEEIPITVKLFGTNPLPASALTDALRDKSDRSEPEQALIQQSIWRSALLRTSSRPVDMVFSIMNVFGVTLDPGSFEKNDRLGATIALVRRVLENGGKASWIGAAYALDPSPEISTFPRFPETSVAGEAYVLLSDGTQKLVVEELSSLIYGGEYLDGIPDSGSMDENGYLRFIAPAARLVGWRSGVPDNMQENPVVIAAGNNECRGGVELAEEGAMIVVRGHNGSVWQLLLDDSGIPTTEPATYLVYIGKAKMSPAPIYVPFVRYNSVRALLVQEHSPGKFHRITFAEIWESWKETLMSLPKVDLSIGGPNPQAQVGN
ncbi:hypothetical protein VNI00_006594 [Paramarasmius palmivorus]|uniref:Heterokaryon incompatibility domain-containing protein n=1 Tax=Paramarasmius palmivorus TaxID=297713 RepID=A0AAW0D798_9AGAR